MLSTDEESSSSGGESDDELGRNLETLLKGKKTSAQLSHEQEEAERQELRRLLAEDKLVSYCSRLLFIYGEGWGLELSTRLRLEPRLGMGLTIRD